MHPGGLSPQRVQNHWPRPFTPAPAPALFSPEPFVRVPFCALTVCAGSNDAVIRCVQEKDVRKWKEELLDQRRRMMEEKLLHAEFKREVQLQAIVKKAQEEEAKVGVS